MSDTTILQDRLNKIADDKLERFIDATFERVGNLHINQPSGYRLVGSNRVSDFGSVIFAMKKLAKETLRQQWRDQETKDFIEKVERIGEEVDELRDQICEVP